MKRSCPFELPPAKRASHSVPIQHKRKNMFEGPASKRRRQDEMHSLQRLIADAYAKIQELEAEVKYLKMVQHASNERMNLPYNHNITCY